MTVTAERAGPGAAGRDPGLDFIRALALILMAAAHFTPPGLADDRWVRLIMFAGQTAPAFYFFAFGMTADRFLAKDRDTRLEQGAMFLYVALAHNALLRGILRPDFLFNLWAWRVILAAIESRRRLPGWAFPAGFAAAAAVLAASPSGLIEYLFRSGLKELPLLPMGLFVIAGVCYRRAPNTGVRRAYVLLLALLTAGTAALYLLSGRPERFFAKAPMTVPYLITLTFINIIFLEGVRKIRGWYPRVPLLPALMEYVSRNLLLATALHYFLLSFMNRLGPFLAERGPGALAWVKPHSAAVQAGGAVAIFAGTVVLLWLTLAGWERVKDRGLLQFLRGRYHAAAIMLLIPLLVLPKLRAMTLEATDFQLGIGPGASALLRLGIDLGIIAVMTYFALELAEDRGLRRSRLTREYALTGSREGPAGAGPPGPA